MILMAKSFNRRTLYVRKHRILSVACRDGRRAKMGKEPTRGCPSFCPKPVAVIELKSNKRVRHE